MLKAFEIEMDSFLSLNDAITTLELKTIGVV